jgi:hypothetical protein
MDLLVNRGARVSAGPVPIMKGDGPMTDVLDPRQITVTPLSGHTGAEISGVENQPTP